MLYNLSQVALFSTLNEQEIQNIQDFCQVKHLCSGEYLFREWDEPQALYILASGRLSVKKWDQSTEIALLSPWTLIWEMAFFWNEKKRSASVVAVEDSELTVILAFSLVQLFWKYPDIQDKLQKMITLREEENKEKGF